MVLPDSYRTNPRNIKPASATKAMVHQPGSIVRIKMKNFVTYTAAEFKCGPSLNMIIGPNGTGKSTLVCAICLGLGFPPSCLGRAKEVGEYVKHGHREAEIEIEIAGGPRHKGRNPTIRSHIKREGNKTQWYINGSSCTRKEVKQLVEKFHIQIDNLCQFLPQDRVVEFAQLTPIELLESTQKAAAPDHMTEWHNELKRLGRDRMKLHQDKNSAKEHLNQLQSRQNQQRAEVERMNERKALLGRVQLLKKAKPAVRYVAEKAKHDNMRKRRDEAQKELRNLEKETEPAMRGVHAKENYCGQISQVLKHRKRMVEKSEDHAKRIETKLDDYKMQIAGCDAELEAEHKSVQKKKQDRKRVELSISRLRDLMDHTPPEFNASEYNIRIREKEREILNLNNRKEELAERKIVLFERARDKKKDRENAANELARLRTKSGQQLNKLKQLSKDTAKAWEWIQQNPNVCDGKVYGPPVIECSVKDPRYTDAVESLVQKNDLIALTVTSYSDFTKLQARLYGESGLNLQDVVIRTIEHDLAHFAPPVSREALSGYGMEKWAIDLLDGPEPILAMLCDNNFFHKTPVSSRPQNDAQYERLSAETSPITSWIAGRQTFRISRRREYGPQASSTMVGVLRPARCWTDQPIDAEYERSLKQKMDELKDELDEFASQADSIKSERDEIMARTEQVNDEKVRSPTSNRKECHQANAHRTKSYRRRILYRKSWRRSGRCRTKLVRHPDRLKLHAVGANRDPAQEEIKLQGIIDNLTESHKRRMDIVSKQEKLSLERGQSAIDYAVSQPFPKDDTQGPYILEQIAVNTLLKHHNDLYEVELWAIEAESELNTLKDRNAEINRLLDERKTEVEQLRRDVNVQKNLSNELLAKFLEAKAAMSPEEQEMIKEWVRPEVSLDDLNAEIEATNGRIELLHAGNPGLIEAYERRQQEIDRLQDTLNNFDARLATLNESVTELREKWEPELDKLVSEISEAFSHNFAQIGCAGQVGIYKDDDDFSQWAIRIEVKFRYVK